MGKHLRLGEEYGESKNHRQNIIGGMGRDTHAVRVLKKRKSPRKSVKKKRPTKKKKKEKKKKKKKKKKTP